MSKFRLDYIIILRVLFSGVNWDLTAKKIKNKIKKIREYLHPAKIS